MRRKLTRGAPASPSMSECQAVAGIAKFAFRAQIEIDADPISWIRTAYELARWCGHRIENPIVLSVQCCASCLRRVFMRPAANPAMGPAAVLRADTFTWTSTSCPLSTPRFSSRFR